MGERNSTGAPRSEFLSGLRVTTAIVVLGVLFAFGDRSFVTSHEAAEPPVAATSVAPSPDGFVLPDNLRGAGNESLVTIETF